MIREGHRRECGCFIPDTVKIEKFSRAYIPVYTKYNIEIGN